MDIISSEAYHKDKVRLTVWKEKFTHWLPLYVTEGTFSFLYPIYINRPLSESSPIYKEDFGAVVSSGKL